VVQVALTKAGHIISPVQSTFSCKMSFRRTFHNAWCASDLTDRCQLANDSPKPCAYFATCRYSGIMILFRRESLQMIASKQFIHWRFCFGDGDLSTRSNRFVAYSLWEQRRIHELWLLRRRPRRGQMNILLNFPCLNCRPADQGKCSNNNGAED
jgi:hypothetical protein